MVAEFTTDLTENRLWLDDQTTGVLCKRRGTAALRASWVDGRSLLERESVGYRPPARFARLAALLGSQLSALS
jgi:hypothetical protein